MQLKNKYYNYYYVWFNMNRVQVQLLSNSWSYGQIRVLSNSRVYMLRAKNLQIAMRNGHRAIAWLVLSDHVLLLV